MRIEQIFLIGAGGHAKVVLDAMSGSGMSDRIIVRDDDPRRAGTDILGHVIHVPIVLDVMSGHRFHLAIGSAAARRMLWEKILSLGVTPHTVMHTAAIVSRYARIGEGAFLAAGSVVGPSAVVGNSVIVNHGAVVDHDCTVGDFCHIAPNATLGGGVRIGNGVLVGAGANVLPGIQIADSAVIGAGAVVTRNVKSGEVLVGIPASEKAK